MMKLKSEPVSSPNTPPMRRAIKKSYRGREQDSGSPTDPILAGNTPDDMVGPSRPTKFRPVHLKLAQNLAEAQRERRHAETDGDDSADEAGEVETRDEPPEAPRRRPRNQSSLHKGNTEDYVKTVAKYSPAVAIPRTTSSKRNDGTDKRTLHRFSNEEHRFIWFYRNDLGCSRGDTYVHFNEYFGLHIRKDSIANTYERLKHKLPAEICDVHHTEPWAVGENRDENTTQPVAASAVEVIEDDTEEAESDAQYTDDGICTPNPTSREQESISHGPTKSRHQGTLQVQPAWNKTQFTKPALVVSGGEARIKKLHFEDRKQRTGIPKSDSSSRKAIVTRRSSYHVNEMGSPMRNLPPPSSRIRRSGGEKRKLEFDVDSDYREQQRVAVKKRSRSLNHR